MHDIRLIRDDPQGFDAALARRGLEPVAAALITLDERRRAAQTELQTALARRNEASKAIGAAKAQKREEVAAALMAEVAGLKETIPALEDAAREADTALEANLAVIPNLPAPDVPAGADESDNVQLTIWGDPREGDFPEHPEFAGPLGLDFESAAAIAGTRFAVLKGGIARLHRAIGQFMLDRNVADWGYTEVIPPLLVRDAAMFGTTQLPKFAEDSFRTTDDRWLIPTAEVSLTNLVREKILDEGELPLRFTALTQCFRAEAGAAGRDTKGLIRQHQFEKVELVSITTPEASEAEHERMTRAAESILEALGLPYRRMLLCAGDMGFAARKTYDLEVWLPGQARYREISSCSNCGDFQARRMNARFRPAGGKPELVHTLNGSALAVGRTLVAVLENCQESDGSVRIPDALRPHMGGLEALTPA
ncbi:serine--tRNA ligase [Sphingomonas sp. MAH-20]|uniref:Serine--tRNA ligase n=1 Tax=Sphingomonas horti TaxID=2682842 RepID=A0A6I4IX37_9SPHN|nr:MULTISPECIES: serine--tRNA ligase [Sphingomonas]MBA2920349.1 serine--tRNA ligase [Sphingomonas sp. CGMCC 1.13658]MVO76603.1 serine--tRNA ligase [Sphingomonas horti]